MKKNGNKAMAQKLSDEDRAMAAVKIQSLARGAQTRASVQNNDIQPAKTTLSATTEQRSASDLLSSAASKKQLGLAKMSQGQNEQALKEFTEALELESKALGDKNTTVAQTKINIASVYQIQGQHDLALKQYTDAQQILKVDEAKNSKALGVVSLNIGSCYLSLEQFESARAAYMEAVRLKKNDFGENHVEV